MIRNQKDYIHYNYTGIRERNRMSLEARASQFNPFDALTGLGAAINKAGFVGDERIELSEDQFREINDLLVQLRRNDSVNIIYYDEDQYKEIDDTFIRFDSEKNIIVLTENRIKLSDVIWLKLN